MPSGVFKPYAGVSTAILIFTKTGAGGTDKVWFYDMKADGFSLDDKRSPIADNDIPDIIARFRNLAGEEGRERTEQSFNKYKKTEYKAIEYAPTSEILDQIDALEAKIQEGLKVLREML